MPTIRTPEPPLPTFTDGTFVTQRRLNALPEHIRQLFAYRMAGFRTEKPMAIVADAAGSIPNNVYTIRNLDTEILDTDNMWSPSAATIIRVNTAGIYMIEWQVALAAPASVTGAPYLAALIYVNGTEAESDTLAFVRTRIEVNQPSQVTVAVPAPLDEGTTVRFGIVQTTGAAQNPDTQNGGCKASLEWLAPLDRKRGAVAL